jgi:hypothetical protein
MPGRTLRPHGLVKRHNLYSITTKQDAIRRLFKAVNSSVGEPIAGPHLVYGFPTTAPNAARAARSLALRPKRDDRSRVFCVVHRRLDRIRERRLIEWLL